MPALPAIRSLLALPPPLLQKMADLLELQPGLPLNARTMAEILTFVESPDTPAVFHDEREAAIKWNFHLFKNHYSGRRKRDEPEPVTTRCRFVVCIYKWKTFQPTGASGFWEPHTVLTENFNATSPAEFIEALKKTEAVIRFIKNGGICAGCQKALKMEGGGDRCAGCMIVRRVVRATS